MSYGGSDAFLVYIARSRFSTPVLKRIGGGGDDRINALSSVSFQAYFAGETNSPDLKIDGQPLKTQYKGGMDVLFGVCSDSISYLAGYYYGGSGDDYAYAISGNRMMIAGKTTSTDLPLKDPISAQLAGPSDAFLARFDRVYYAEAPILSFATYLGGSGEDEIRALSFPVSYSAVYPPLSFAGTTTSTDLPVVNAAQSKYGGGPSDAFAGRIDLNTPSVTYLTYIGGSGRDEAAAMGINGISDDVIAGATTSPDLPVAGAFQDRLAGAEDAWLGVFSAAGVPQSLSYFGGSGSDRALAMAVTGTNSVTLAGDTDSPDLPAPVVNTATLASGGRDGFTAGLSLPRFAVNSSKTVWTAKDLTTTTTVYVAVDVPEKAQFTVSSSDPSRVLVSLGSNTARLGRISAPLTTLGRGNITIYLTGAADSGEAVVTVDVTGLGSQTFPVRLGPVVVMPFPPGYPSTLYFRQTLSLVPYAGVVNEAGGFTRGTLKPGGLAPVVNYSVSNPAVATLSGTRYDFGTASTSYSAITLTPLSAGEITLSAACDGVPFYGPASVSYTIVHPKVSLDDFAAGKDLEMDRRFRSDVSLGPDYTATITTDSPDKICFRADSGTDCRASATIHASSGVIVRALADSGSAIIRYSSDQLGNGAATVQLTAPKLFLAPLTKTLAKGSSSTVYVGYGSAVDNGSTASLRPGLNPAITVASSDPQVLSVAGQKPPFSVQALESGHVALTASAPGFVNADPVEIAITPAPVPKLRVDVGRVIVGKDLQTSVVPQSTAATVPVRARSSAPELVVISTDLGRRGAAEAEAPSPHAFYLQALAGEGSATITFSAPGHADANLQVQLTPSGFAWTSSALAVPAFGSARLSYGSYALDPDSLVPVAFQSLRPGITARPVVTNSTPLPGEITFSAGAELTFTARGTGLGLLWLTQPAGFTSPSARTEARVIVNPIAIRATAPAFLGKDLQISFTVEVAGRPRLTVRSDDPARLLVSADATAPGSAQADVQGGTNTVYLQGLASEGTVLLRVSGEGVQEAFFPVMLTPARIALTTASTQLTTYSADVSMTASLFVDAPLNTYLGAGQVTLRPGALPFDVPVTSTQPAVAKPLSSTLKFTPGTGSATFSVRPQDPGEAIIRLEPPPPFHGDTNQEQVLLKVGRPSFRPETLKVGRDLAKQISLQVAGNVSLHGTVLLTLVSSDPNRVLLADSPTQPGQARIVVPYSTSNSTAIYVYGISEGSAAFTLSTPGFDDTRYDVSVTAPGISLGAAETAFIGQAAEFHVYCETGQSVRPGAKITVTVRSSNPAVATIPSTVVIESGKAMGSAPMTALSEGQFTIIADDAGFSSTSRLSFAVKVAFPPLPLSWLPATYSIGKNLQQYHSTSYSGSSPLTVTVTSSDPSKLRVSTDPKTTGLGTMTLALGRSSDRLLYIQALADSGSAILTFSAPGYAATAATVTLCPSAFSFDSSVRNTVLPNPFDFNVNVAPVLPQGAYSAGAQTLFVDTTVTVAPGDAAMGTVTPASLTFKAGENRATATFKPAAPGTTALKIEPPPGFSSTNPPSQLVVMVKDNRIIRTNPPVQGRGRGR